MAILNGTASMAALKGKLEWHETVMAVLNGNYKWQSLHGNFELQIGMVQPQWQV